MGQYLPLLATYRHYTLAPFKPGCKIDTTVNWSLGLAKLFLTHMKPTGKGGGEKYCPQGRQ